MLRNNNWNLWLGFAFLLFLLSCGKKEVGPQGGDAGSVPDQFKNGLFIMNEGNFGTNNGSVTYYSPEEKNADNHLFQAANGGKKLGDVVQSMTIVGNYAYIVVNNSKKIEVVNMEDFASIATITQLKSPRYVCVVNNEKVYVTNFVLGEADNVIHIIDPMTHQVTGTIAVKGWVEHMVYTANHVFVCNMQQDKLQVIDPATDNIVKVIPLNEEPQSMVIDHEGFLWVLCTGGFDSGLPALIKINPVNMEIVKKLENFSISDYPVDLCIDGSGENLFFLNNGVYKMPVTDTVIPHQSFIDYADIQYVYSLAVDPVNGDIYLTDAEDFQQAGEVYRYDRNALQVDRFEVGEGPGTMLFYY